jgi:hypothetical protein
MIGNIELFRCIFGVDCDKGRLLSWVLEKLCETDRIEEISRAFGWHIFGLSSLIFDFVLYLKLHFKSLSEFIVSWKTLFTIEI